MSDDTETLAEVLAAAFEDHHWHTEVSPPEGVDPYLWCVCGWRSDDATDAHWASGEHARLAHEHVAEQTAARIEQARAGEAALRERVEAIDRAMSEQALAAWRSAEARKGLNDHESLLQHADALSRWSERLREAMRGRTSAALDGDA